MPFSFEDMNAIKQELDDRYVMQADCNEKQAQIEKKFANDDKRIEKQESFNDSIKKFLWVILTAVVGEVVLSFLNLIR